VIRPAHSMSPRRRETSESLGFRMCTLLPPLPWRRNTRDRLRSSARRCSPFPADDDHPDAHADLEDLLVHTKRKSVMAWRSFSAISYALLSFTA